MKTIKIKTVNSFAIGLIVILAITGCFGEAKSDQSKKIVVAVLDTGIDPALKQSNMLCDKGHKDFTDTGLDDHHGHGTHVSGLIHQYALNLILTNNSTQKDIEKFFNMKTNYCQVILKYYDPKNKNSGDTELAALKYAIKLKVDIINISGGGLTYVEEEKTLIKKALDMGIKVVVAAGNESNNLDVVPYYPASLDSRLIVVGNLNSYNLRATTSNYGTKVNSWEHGVDVLSLLPNGAFGKLTGTSQATAIKTGKIINKMR